MVGKTRMQLLSKPDILVNTEVVACRFVFFKRLLVIV